MYALEGGIVSLLISSNIQTRTVRTCALSQQPLIEIQLGQPRKEVLAPHHPFPRLSPSSPPVFLPSLLRSLPISYGHSCCSLSPTTSTPTSTSSSPVPVPDLRAIALLRILVLASRSNASAICAPADSLLQYVTSTPPSGPRHNPEDDDEDTGMIGGYPRDVADGLLRETLELYAVLIGYGMYVNITITAAVYFARV